ncbi:IS66 family transposase (plasmid) [Skermanella sp. TT6]|uniref:IS66 family transposase n=1 Tax=Skermanella cutis TaxID=2775420 RepID=A0ABX7BM31_9PROT|nr:IS66 family transposase [Skermanella sp. TT6]QQP87460.1 IS66 family transposase [Skermanella sp. TT6]QQP92946.1 IS66 family transposase [Skermanella sp. TT6]QQP93498.1 IS66 family transposase [Skermanella sp. TT6]
MEKPPRYRLSEAEKDALLVEQAALIERLAARVAELEALVGKPRKTSANSHIPPSQDGPGGASRKADAKRRRKPRPSRPGVSRPLADDPDRTERRLAECCPHCGTAVPEAAQRCRHRYDHIDLPVIRPVVTRVELFGGRCGDCGRRYRAAPPAAMPPGTPFGPGIRALLAYLHHSHHVGFERLSRMLEELFGLTISEGAIANALRRMGVAFDTACAAIKAKLLGAPVIASDETTTRVNGVTHWQWVFHSGQAVLHTIAPGRGRAVPAGILGGHRPEVWISDRYAGQQELGRVHQVCLAHVLRDVQYAIDCGDTVVAPKIRDHLRWAIRVGKRRPGLKDSTLAAYAAKAERDLDALVGVPAAHPAGRELQRLVKAWRGKFFVFLADRRVPPTNNGSEQEIRPSVVFRKVTNGFRSDWGPDIHAGYRSVIGTARRQGQSAWTAIRDLIGGTFAVA